MATRGTTVEHKPDGSVELGWAGLAFNVTGDVGASVRCYEYQNRTFSVSGTFGVGGSISLKGSFDNTTFAALKDAKGNDLTLTEAGTVAVHSIPPYVRPEVNAGDGDTALAAKFISR